MIADPKSQPKKLKDDKKDEVSIGTIGILLGLVIITIAVVLLTEPMRANYENREQIGKMLCQNVSLIYDRYDSFHQTIVCHTNLTYNSEHFNVSPQQFQMIITPDWQFYQPKKAK